MSEEDKVNESILNEISIRLKVLIGNKDKHLFSLVQKYKYKAYANWCLIILLFTWLDVFLSTFNNVNEFRNVLSNITGAWPPFCFKKPLLSFRCDSHVQFH